MRNSVCYFPIVLLLLLSTLSLALAQENPEADIIFKKHDNGDMIPQEMIDQDLQQLSQLISPTDTSRLEKLQQLKCWHYPSNSADEITEALHYATQLMNDIPANASNSYRTDITLCQAWYLQLSGDVNGAFEGYNRGVKSAYEHEDLKLIADSTSLRGFLYSYIGDFSAALNDLVTAQGLYESLNLTGWANFNLNGIATSFRRYGDPQSAIRYYKKLKEIYLQTNKTEPAIFVTSDIGLALDELGEHEQAIEQFQIAYRYHKEQQEANTAAIAETNIAYSLIKLKRFTEAERYLTQAQKVINETDPTAYSFMKLMLAELYFMRGEYNAAIEAATQSEQSFRSIQNHRGLVKLLPLKSDIYAAMSDYPAAHRTLKDFIQVNKTVDGNSLSQQTTQLKVKFDTSRIESENKRLIENQQLKEQELELLKKNKSLQYVILLLAGCILSIVSTFAYKQVSRNRQLQIIALTDHLTQLPNRRHIYTQAVSYFAKANEQSTPFTVLICDVDHFKQINDNFGHELGDKALNAIAQAGRALTGNNERMGRIGGEEFLILLPNTDAKEAQLLAQKLQANITQISQRELPPALTLTVSIGVATFKPTHAHSDQLDKDFSGLLKRADKALYEAKNAGRNCIKLADA